MEINDRKNAPDTSHSITKDDRVARTRTSDTIEPTMPQVTSKNLRIRFFDYNSPDLDKFGIVLALTFALLVILLLVDLSVDAIDPRLSSVGVAVATASVLAYSLRASGVSRRYSVFIGLLLLIGLGATIFTALINILVPQVSDHIHPQNLQPLWVIVAAVTPVATIYRFLQHTQVTTRTLAAAISAYLQIAIAFTFTFLLIDDYTGGSFFAQTQPSTDYMYFSIVTISTVGYGDLTAAHSVGHAFSALEALIGQIYLVIIVAMLVSIYTTTRKPIATHAKTPKS
ncbi:hypothetical protein I8H83_01850 [Candidatus Saccharibacteria bacterium]|nr:hypothetical protein [Candidatus Saccharibacteria bacterium]MBH2007326.1 hypothetical protein [Candidatus Saccharibacteria bacterium]